MLGSGAEVRLVYIFQLLVLNDKHVLCPGCATQNGSVRSCRKGCLPEAHRYRKERQHLAVASEAGGV